MNEFESREFPEINDVIDVLKCTTDEYRIEALVRAIFCINICISNRSFSSTRLALNACIIRHSGTGSKEINNYNDFVVFFESIVELLQPVESEDFLIEDFGDARIEFESVFYRVILGTGHENAFACLNFLPVLARETSHSKDLQTVLEYFSSAVAFFRDINVSNKTGENRFICPSECLFQRTAQFFESEYPKYDSQLLFEIVESSPCIIENCHFVRHDDKVYPLFNESLLIYLYDKWFQSIDEETQILVANKGVIRRVLSLFCADQSEKPHMLAPAAFFKNQKPVSISKPFVFAACSTRGVIIAINKDEYEYEELEKVISIIEETHSSGNLQIGEIYDRFGSNILRAFGIPKEIPLEYILFDSYTNPCEDYMKFGEANKANIKECTALDLIYYLDFIDDLDELFEYLQYSCSDDFDFTLSLGSDSALFFTWKAHGRFISKGALQYGLLSLTSNIENEAVLNYFTKELKDFPFVNGDSMFNDPFLWKICNEGEGEYSYTLKYAKGFGGKYIVLPKRNYAFLSHNVDFYNSIVELQNCMNVIRLFDELIIEGLRSVENLFESQNLMVDSGIQIVFMPLEYAKRSGHFINNNDERDYVFSEAENYNGHWQIVYVVKDVESIIHAIQTTKDRSLELAILKEVLLPFLRENNFLETFNVIVQDKSKEKKKVDVATFSIKYCWNESNSTLLIKEHHLHSVRKRIAQICRNHGIKPGIYNGKDANTIIRSMQQALVEDFEKEVKKYSWFDTHARLLDYHSNLLHLIGINRRRYSSYGDVDEETHRAISNKILQDREQAKRDDRNVLYLLETNLYLKSNSVRFATSDDICIMLAYSNWLVVLNDVADICYWVESEASVEVTDEYIVNTIQDEENADLDSELIKRMYESSYGLKRNNGIDDAYVRKLEIAFHKDMGFDLKTFIEVLTYFYSGFNRGLTSMLGDNVYMGNKKKLLDDFCHLTNNEYVRDDLEKIVTLLSVDSSELKTVNDKKDFYLPIGHRKDRNVRYEMKPLVAKEADIVFSPICLYQLERLWLDGIQDFIMPYEIQMDAVKEVVDSWKREYEKQIVCDIANLFSEMGFEIVKKNFELMKLNREHPQFLGDYDVFAVNTHTHSVWIIECKVLEKVESIFEAYHQQESFFLKHRHDEKFQRRIDYMIDNLNLILNQLGVDSSENYEVIPYMCMNKIMVSRYKKIGFSIVSFSELERIVKGDMNK